MNEDKIRVAFLIAGLGLGMMAGTEIGYQRFPLLALVGAFLVTIGVSLRWSFKETEDE